MLAVFAQIAGAGLALNELAETRREVLRALFEGAPISDHDAASIDDRLDRAITPSVIVMNPPAGRLVVITGESFAPKTKSHQSTFRSIGEVAEVVFSAAIAGKVFAQHGTSIDTRLTVIDKRSVGDDTVKYDAEDVYHPLCETTDDLLAAVMTHCRERPNAMPPCPTGARQIAPKSATRLNLHALRDAARQETRDLAAERAKHPFDSIEAIPLAYQPKVWTDPQGTLQDAVYEDYALQAFQIEGAATHPTSLVQSAAMASVPPPLPTYQPLLPSVLTCDGVLSAPQLESVIYAGHAHACHLKGWFKPSEIAGQLVAASETDEGAFRLRKGWFLGDGTGCGKGRQVAGVIVDNWLRGRKRAVWVSKSDKLIEDAKRDWMAVGGRDSDIVPLSKYRQGSDIRLAEGILFITYATLRSAEREGKASRCRR